MYSPKIDPAFVSKLYKLAKARGTRMTKLVNVMLRKGVEEMESADASPACPARHPEEKTHAHKGGER